jgi:hypothetical protein
MLKKYPAALPVARKADRAYQMVDPLVSTPFDSGKTRWDRRFTDVPFSTPVTWIFTNAQYSLFRTWYKNLIRDGADWFEMPLAADDGREVRECHFVQGYSGPDRLGFDRWRVSASLVLRRLPVIDPDWLDASEYWLPPGISIFDRAVNYHWPRNAISTLTTESGDVLSTEGLYEIASE